MKKETLDKLIETTEKALMSVNSKLSRVSILDEGFSSTSLEELLVLRGKIIDELARLENSRPLKAGSK